MIFNPKARGEAAGRFREILKTLAAECTLLPTTQAGDGRRLGEQAIRQGFTHIVAVGGDGTLNEVVNGMAVPQEGFRQASLGVIPLGTVNVFARELGLPERLEESWHVAMNGRERVIDLLRVEYPGAQGGVARIVLQLAGAGLDARAVELADWELKRRIGRLSYAVSALRAFFESHPELVVSSESGELRGEQVFIGNGRLYGGNAVLFPDARLDDGRIHLGVVKRLTVPVALRFAWRFLSARPSMKTGSQQFPMTVLGCAGPVEIRSLSGGRAALQIDGEACGALPVRITKLPGILRVRQAG